MRSYPKKPTTYLNQHTLLHKIIGATCLRHLRIHGDDLSQNCPPFKMQHDNCAQLPCLAHHTSPSSHLPDDGMQVHGAREHVHTARHRSKGFHRCSQHLEMVVAFYAAEYISRSKPLEEPLLFCFLNIGVKSETGTYTKKQEQAT